MHDMNLEEKLPAETAGQTSELWASFISTRNEAEYLHGWLVLQSTVIAGTIQSLLVVTDGAEQFRPVAAWPEKGGDPSRLSDIVERVMDEQCGLLAESDREEGYTVAYPVFIDSQLHGVVALELVGVRESQLQHCMEALQWGVAWVELLVRRKEVDENRALLERLKASVDLLALTLGKESFTAAATVFTTQLASARDCERVSIGFLRGKRLKLQAVSHSAEVGGKMNLTRSIERVMDEAILQRREIVYPQKDEQGLIYREHEALSRQQSMASIASFPLFGSDHYFGALTCERGADNPFDERDVEFIRAVAALAGLAMESKYVNDRSLLAKNMLSGKQQLGRVFGAGYLGRKLFLAMVISLVCFFSVAEGEYRLTAQTTLEGAIRRAIVVPVDGFIDEAPVRAGDVIKKGQLLCGLDGRDLYLVKLAKSSEYSQLERQHQEAVANHDRAQAKIIDAQIAQSRVELELINEKLARTQLTAPFGGLVVNGDLSQRLGSAVKQGEVLFEMTPLDGYRVLLKVDERRINDVVIGQQGMLILSSLPDHKFGFTVANITPLSTAEEGRTYFRVEADLDSMDERLRPGMEGVGKININRQKLFSIWTREMVEWFKLLTWSWLP